MTLEELEKRLRTLEDIEEIKKLQAHYVNCLITAKWDELVDCFAENGVFDAHAGVAKGKAAMTKLFTEEISKYHIGQEGNFVVQPIISVEGDKAKGSWLIYIQFALPRKLRPKPAPFPSEDAPAWVQGFYEMEYVKEAGKWKISSLKWRCRLVSPWAPSQ
jgi:hypothetical protein